MQPNPPNPAVSIESLLAHADWVRALAKRLVADPASAEDLEQEVWRTALESPPRDATNPRGWLASVARNAARSLGRSNSRREERERRSARKESLPPASELVAEAELARELAGEVLALEEPYRTVLLLRYWRALSPDEIARSQSVPLETVHSQLRRGMERLRVRLDRRHGSRTTWLSALAPLAREKASTTSSAIGGGGSLLQFGVAVGLLGILVWVWATRAKERTAFSTLAPELSAGLRPEESQNERAGPVASPSSTRGAESASRNLLPQRAETRVEVVDVWGRPRPNLGLIFRANPPEESGSAADSKGHDFVVTTDSAGRCTPGKDADLQSGRVAGGREVVLGTAAENPVGILLITAPITQVRGVVRDQDGNPIDGAVVSFSTYPGAALFKDVLRVPYPRHEVSSGSAGKPGSFELEAPWVPFNQLSCSKEGYQPFTLVGIDAGSGDITARLEHETEHPRNSISICGRVVGPDGVPVSGASVDSPYAYRIAQTDDTGAFSLDVFQGDANREVVAYAQGLIPARAVIPDGSKPSGSRADLVLVLGTPTLSISGRVQTQNEQVPKSAHVIVLDPTRLCHPSNSIEECLASPRSGTLDPLTGAFQVDGLLDRPYVLALVDEEFGVLCESGPLRPPNSSAILDCAASDLSAIDGYVCGLDGAPVKGAKVFLLPSARNPRSGSPLAQTRTAADGSFRLERATKRGGALVAWGDRIEDTSYQLAGAPRSAIRIHAARMFKAHLTVSDSSIDGVVFEDSAGKPLVPVHFFLPGHSGARLLRAGSGFPLVMLSERASQIVLYRGDVAAQRMPLSLVYAPLIDLSF